MDHRSIAAAAVFAFRCAGGCVVAYEIALWLHLQQPVWAAMSALIVSQAHFADTRASLGSRIAATVVGALIAVLVGSLGARVGASTMIETAVGVALAALVSHRFPALRVAMWTCVIVLLTAGGQPLLEVALRRAGEVCIGSVVGWAFHWTAEKLFGARFRGLTGSATSPSMDAPGDG